MDQITLLKLLSTAAQHGASDVHLQVGSVPSFRIKGDLIQVRSEPLTEQDMQAIFSTIVQDPAVRDKFASIRDYDGSFEVQKLGRFRYNLYRNSGRIGFILRLIPASVPSVEKLGLSPVTKIIAGSKRGLVLVTGATGSGKTSTLAAMMDYLNANYPLHIVTIEDPIEYVHTPKKGRISQREVGRDTGGFSDALRAALRQDPDVILVGEMRDRETIDIALKAAETGHMVFSTVHTPDAIKTIGRLLAVFPAEEQRGVRMRLADNLNAIISQRLIPRADSQGMVVAQEVLINNTGVTEAIINPEMTSSIKEFIKNGYKSDLTGSQTFDQHLVWLFKKRLITAQIAKESASNPSDFERNLIFDGKAQGGTTNPGLSPANLIGNVELEAPKDFPAADASRATQTRAPGPPPAPPGGIKSRTDLKGKKVA